MPRPPRASRPTSRCRSGPSICGTGCRSACVQRTPWTRRVPPPDAATDLFEAHRSRLVRLAYRMLGSTAEAEDIVQEAWLRWRRADLAEIREPAAFLTRTVTRLCLDTMRSARA